MATMPWITCRGRNHLQRNYNQGSVTIDSGRRNRPRGVRCRSVFAIDGGLGRSLGKLLRLRAVIPRIDAGVVRRLVDGTPIGAMDAASIGRTGAVGEGAGDLYPSILKTGDQANERGEFAEILVLAKDQCHVEFVSMGRIQRVERQPHVDSLFLAAKESVLTEAGNLEGLGAVDQRAAANHDPTPTHHCQLIRPEPVPEGVIRDGGNAGVELHALQRPSVSGADGLRQLLDVEIRVRVSESVAGVMEEVLSVNECDRAFDGWFGGHGLGSKKYPD